MCALGLHTAHRALSPGAEPAHLVLRAFLALPVTHRSPVTSHISEGAISVYSKTPGKLDTLHLNGPQGAPPMGLTLC